MKIYKLTILCVILFTSASALGQPKKKVDENVVRSAKINGIHYYDVGNGKTKKAVVLIHGWTGNADTWKETYAAFPRKRVIAIDLPGHGKSDTPRITYSMEHFARAVDTVLTNAGVEKAVLVGHSMGTPVARQFYRLYPQKTLGIVVVDGALRQFFTKATVDQFFAPLRTNYKENAARFIDGMLTTMKDDALKKSIRESTLATPDYVALSAMEEMMNEKIWGDDKIDVPVLALMAPSPFWPANLKDQYASLAPKLEFQAWNGVGHFLHMEKPKEFNEQVAGFIARNKLL